MPGRGGGGRRGSAVGVVLAVLVELGVTGVVWALPFVVLVVLPVLAVDRLTAVAGLSRDGADALAIGVMVAGAMAFGWTVFGRGGPARLRQIRAWWRARSAFSRALGGRASSADPLRRLRGGRRGG